MLPYVVVRDWLDFGAKKGSTPDLNLSYGLSVMSVFECGWYQIQAPCNTGTSDETDCFWILSIPYVATQQKGYIRQAGFFNSR